MDPYFDEVRKPEEPRRPWISTGGVAWLSCAAIVIAFLGFASQQPKAAGEFVEGIALATFAIVLVLKG